MPKTAAQRAEVSFFTNYLFSAVITRAHTPNQTHSVFPIHNASKTRLTPFFVKLLFFGSLLLLLTPETLPNHLFRKNQRPKMVKKDTKKYKNKISFFYNLFHIFPLPLRKKTKPLIFSAVFVIGNRKTARENVP